MPTSAVLEQSCASAGNSPYPRSWFRFFEILPGAAVWIAILSPFILSHFYPLVVTIFIILFDVYWLITSFSYGWYLLYGYRRLRRHLRTDWGRRLEALPHLSAREQERLQLFPWEELYHAVILPTYNEDIAILEASLLSVLEADYRRDRLIFVLAIEERAGAPAQERAAYLQKTYGHEFAHFLVSTHPDGIVGEVKAKGANATWAAKQLTTLVKAHGIPLNRVIVSTGDADSRYPSQYFACLAYKYLTQADRTRCAFQPVAMYFNNIWETPMLSRILAFGTTFWQLIESIRDYRLITFATHSMSLETLVEMDYWCTTIVNEDSRQFFRAYFRFSGQFRNVPLFMPIYMDAVHVGSIRGTLKNLYLQQQRWAYGVEHFPYIVMESFRQRDRIPAIDRFALIWRAWLGAFSWATTSFFITIVGWLPIALNDDFREQVIASNFPITTQALLSLTWIGLLVSSYMTLRLLPRLPQGKRPYHLFTMVLQWILVPITAIFFGAIPGIDAQTRLMFGRYLGFRVTDKKLAR